MGSNKKNKRKRRHQSSSPESRDRESKKKHHHKKHKKHKRHHHPYESQDSDIEILSSPEETPISKTDSPPPPPIITIQDDSSEEEDDVEEQESHISTPQKSTKNRTNNEFIEPSGKTPNRKHDDKVSGNETNGNNYEASSRRHSETDSRRQFDKIKLNVSYDDEDIENKGGGGVVESLSIEETNRVRAKLGLKPLQVNENKSNEGSKDSSGKIVDDLGEFYHKPASNIAEQKRQEKLRERIVEKRDKRKIEKKLTKIKTLGESSDDEGDGVESWVDRSRRLQLEKQKAQQRAKMLEELDKEFGVGELVEDATREQKAKAYTQRHLKGLRVEHDMESFEEGASTVLTLKDKPILGDDDEDVLVNVNLIDNERYQTNIELKKKKGVYNPYGDEEFDEHGNPIEKDILAQYSETEKKSFQIGFDTNDQQRKIKNSIREKLSGEKKRLENLQLPELRIAADYYTEEEMQVKFKKPRKKNRKLREKGRMLKVDDEEMSSKNVLQPATDHLKDLGSRRRRLPGDSYMDIDDIPPVEIKQDEIKMELDEDDAELSLALDRARRLKQMEPKKQLPKIEPIKEESIDDNMATNSYDDPTSSNIILNSTAEFCRTLGDIPTYGRAGNRESEQDILDFEKEELEQKRKNPHDDDDDESTAKAGVWNAVENVDANQPRASALIKISQEQQHAAILDEEPDVGAGVAAALKLAMSKGYLEKEASNRPSTSRLAHLQAKNYSIEDKNIHGDDDKFGRRDRYAGPTVDFKEKEAYKPNVKLEYIDDEGHILNAKEAFRYLSHKFHGKGPGKNKIEKRLKKSEQDTLMKKMSSTDTPLGTLQMLQAKQKEMQSSYVVLSGTKPTTTISKLK